MLTDVAMSTQIIVTALMTKTQFFSVLTLANLRPAPIPKKRIEIYMQVIAAVIAKQQRRRIHVANAIDRAPTQRTLPHTLQIPAWTLGLGLI